MKSSDGSFLTFKSVSEARASMGFTDENVAFRWDLASKVEWALEDANSLSYTVTFDTDQLQNQFIDNKHDHDSNKCYLSDGVEFDRTRCRFEW